VKGAKRKLLLKKKAKILSHNGTNTKAGHGILEPVKSLIRLDFTKADMFQRCAKQYEFRYEEGLKRPPKIAMIEGSSHHTALEVNNKHKIKEGVDLRHQDLTDIFIKELRERTNPDKLNNLDLSWEDEDEDKLLSRAKIFHREYISKIATTLNPTASEEKIEKVFNVDDEEFELVAILDVTHRKKQIYDYKVSKKSKYNQVHTALQLTVQACLAKVWDVGYIEFLKKANPEVGVLTSKRSPSQVRWALKIIASIAKSIRLKTFPLINPDSWVCQEKYCGYWSMCRGRVE